MSDLAYESKKEKITVAQQQKVLGQIDEKMRNNFRILSNYFKAGEISLEGWLNELIPDAKLRPFLTPTSGAIIPEGHDYTVLHHNGITELILRCNLRDAVKALVTSPAMCSAFFNASSGSWNGCQLSR